MGIDAILLLITFAMILFIQIRVALQPKNTENTVPSGKKQSKWQTFIYIVIGFIGIIAGGKLAVTGATEIAKMLGISETIIGLTVVAIGTSLPELVTSVVATKRGETGIAIGNVIGSNIFNILFILGASALCTPIQIQLWTLYDLLVLVAINVVMYIIGLKGYFNRRMGAAMIGSYIGYTAWIIIR